MIPKQTSVKVDHPRNRSHPQQIMMKLHPKWSEQMPITSGNNKRSQGAPVVARAHSMSREAAGTVVSAIMLHMLADMDVKLPAITVVCLVIKPSFAQPRTSAMMGVPPV
jgi:hypothetical protein